MRTEFGDVLNRLMHMSQPDGRLGRYLVGADVTELWQWSLSYPERVVRISDGEAEHFPLGSASPQRDC